MKKHLVTVCLAIALVAVATVLPAQEPAPYITVHYDTIDPSGTQAFEQNSKDWVEAFAAAGAGEEYFWRAYQSGFTYAWVSDLPNYAYIDDAEARDKAATEMIGEDKMNELVAGAQGSITSHYSEIWKYQADMSYAPEGFDPSGMKAISVSFDTVKSDKGKEYQALVKEAIEAMKKVEAPVNFFSYSIPFGRGGYAWVTFGENRADLHSGPQMGELLTKAVGEERAQAMFSEFLDCIATTEDRDWRIRQDLAYVGEAAASAEAMDKASE